MELRRYRQSDGQELAELFYHTVHTVNAKDYTEQQLDAWATGRVDLEKWDQSLQAHYSVVAVAHGIAVGFGDIDSSGYLDRLFVHADHQGKGIATAICDRLEQAVGGTIITHASITARPFFEKRGYIVVNEQQVERQGVFLTNFVMRKERLTYRTLCASEIDRGLFRAFVRHQAVDQCLRWEDGAWVVRSDPFVDDWGEGDYQFLITCLQNTIKMGGAVYGAFREGTLKGFASVEHGLFGGENRYLDLTSLHVSEDMRRLGIGRTLFQMAAEWARIQGAAKLYISAHSAIETQNFYRSLGCVEAVEPQLKHVEAEPFDCQLEYKL